MSARHRMITTAVWEDEWFAELDSDGKVLWFYLLTNHRTSLAGIYVIQPRFIAFESGLSVGRVSELLQRFESEGKIVYEDNVLWVRKLRDYQHGAGGKNIDTLIDKDYRAIPEGRVKQEYAIRYGYSIGNSIDTVSDAVSIPSTNSNGTVARAGASCARVMRTDSDSDSLPESMNTPDRCTTVEGTGTSEEARQSVSLSHPGRDGKGKGKTGKTETLNSDEPPRMSAEQRARKDGETDEEHTARIQAFFHKQADWLNAHPDYMAAMDGGSDGR